MFYDPMIAKLCTWGPERIVAINAMQDALDEFEVEGISHNLPFLSAMMGHERFRHGNISTAFIAEEFPEGFKGVEVSGDDLNNLARIAAYIHAKTQERAAQVSGTIPNHQRKLGKDWVVTLGAQSIVAHVVQETVGHHIALDDEKALLVSSAWQLGQTLGHFRFNGHELSVKVSISPKGIRLRRRGMDILAQVRTPHVAALATLMPIKKTKDLSKHLLCPMPGLLRVLSVNVGDTVEPGQAVAVVEAMKMENVLRAASHAKVKHVAAKVGDSLAVDQLIVEFE